MRRKFQVGHLFVVEMKDNFQPEQSIHAIYVYRGLQISNNNILTLKQTFHSMQKHLLKWNLDSFLA